MTEPDVEIVDVTSENWRACVALQVQDEQEAFVASVPYYLALCNYEDTWHPLAIKSGAEIVGFAMWGIDPADDSFWIGGLLIDRRHQGRGYGRAAVGALLERAAAGGRDAALSYDRGNEPARSLYASLGFGESGEINEDGEVVARIPLDRMSP